MARGAEALPDVPGNVVSGAALSGNQSGEAEAVSDDPTPIPGLKLPFPVKVKGNVQEKFPDVATGPEVRPAREHGGG